MSRLLATLAAVSLLGLASATTAGSMPTATGTTHISYGASVRLTGTVPADRRQAPTMSVLTLACGFSTYTRVAQFKMPADGRYSYSATPTISTIYSMRAGDLEVSKRNVRVRPLVALVKAGARYRVDVTSAGGTTFGGKAIVFERARSAKGPWTKVSAPKLKHTSSPTALNAIASATLAQRLPAGTYLRARFPQTSTRPCYDAATSAAVRV